MDKNYCDKSCDCQPIAGVSCDVTACRHHDGRSNCTAPHIKVGNCMAGDEETRCETYAEKAE